MKILKHLLTLVAFGYLCYHIYTFGPGMFNVTVLVILVLSSIANYFRENVKVILKQTKTLEKLVRKQDMQETQTIVMYNFLAKLYNIL